MMRRRPAAPRKVQDAFGLYRDLFYLLQNNRGDGAKELQAVRDAYGSSKPAFLRKLERSVRKDIAKFKRQAGCVLSDEDIRSWVARMTSGGDGWVYISKWTILTWFTKYERVFSRWPHMPLHTMIMFDTDPDARSPFSVWTAEGAIFDELELTWKGALSIASDGKTFRSRSQKNQLELHAFLRLAVSSAYQLVEAYVNGIAFDCFMANHDRLELGD